MTRATRSGATRTRAAHERREGASGAPGGRPGPAHGGTGAADGGRGRPRRRGPDHADAADGPDDFDDYDFDGFLHRSVEDMLAGERSYSFVYAPHGNVNSGTLHGVSAWRTATARVARRTRRRAPRRGARGSLSEAEILAARKGFAEPDWFPEALAELDEGCCS
ncbi:hypothetical protein NKH77_25645 [Streptomyces sp. M19]